MILEPNMELSFMRGNKYGPICIPLHAVIQPLSNVSVFRQTLCYFYDLA